MYAQYNGWPSKDPCRAAPNSTCRCWCTESRPVAPHCLSCFSRLATPRAGDPRLPQSTPSARRCARPQRHRPRSTHAKASAGLRGCGAHQLVAAPVRLAHLPELGTRRIQQCVSQRAAVAANPVVSPASRPARTALLSHTGHRRMPPLEQTALHFGRRGRDRPSARRHIDCGAPRGAQPRIACHHPHPGSHARNGHAMPHAYERRP